MGSAASCGVAHRDIRVLIAGIEGAGKTTILYRLRLGETVQASPTVGFNVETIRQPGADLTMWDVGGNDKIIPLWRHYTTGSQVVIYVVDSSDRQRFPESAHALHNLLTYSDMEHTPVVVLANKANKDGAVSTDEITKELRLDSLKSRDWHVVRTCALTGDGLKGAMSNVIKLALQR